MAEEQVPPVEEEVDDSYDKSRQRINLGIHPLGGIILDVVDAYGRNAVIQLDQQVLSQLVLNMITLNVIASQQEAQARAVAADQLKSVWTPPS